MRARTTGKGQGPLITTNILPRIFHVRVGARKGTAFSIDVDGRQYLVTAAHLLRQLGAGVVVELLHGAKWKPIEAVVVGLAAPQVDVAVLALQFRITLPEFTIEPSMVGLTSGQDAYCLGFPFGERGGAGTSAQKFPVPFIKKVAVSYMPDTMSPVRCLYLTGLGNPGFSGGPVAFREEGRMNLKIAAVVSTFQYETEPVYVGSEALHLNPQHNSDIIVSYDIKHALDLIHLNPVGAQLSESGRSD